MKRIGFGQVEPNHLSAKRNGKIYAQLPAAEGIAILENGMFAKYDYAAGEVNFGGEGEWMLVYNEVKLYDDAWRESYKDFALRASDFSDGKMYPRLFKTDIGDIFTTNCLKAEVDFDNVTVGMKLAPNANGYLEAFEGNSGMIWKVVKVYTMPDGQPGVKIQRVQ